MSGDSRAMNSALETINAAATAIALAENRIPQASIRKRRWGSGWLSTYWCFGSPNRNRKRIGHVVPETTTTILVGPTSEDPSHPPPPILLPFVAPPSSPASFLHSEAPSAAQSPVGLVSVSASMYSPGGPASIFAIGPYAHETQLVSPPVFSTFTTEPSTAPYTPPAESVHFITTTTPPSPEVPFARLFDPNPHRFPVFHTELHSYQLHPGSLISPSSGASSPLPDPYFLEFWAGKDKIPPPGLLSLDKLSTLDWGSRLGSGSLTPDAKSEDPRCRSGEPGSDRRVSFELAEAVSTSLTRAAAAAAQNDAGDDVAPHQKHRSITLGSSKEFNFDNVDAGGSHETGVGSDWWANKVAGNEASSVSASGSASQNWSFFSVVQPSVS